MTTVELAQHLLSVTALNDVATAPAREKQDLALVMTQAVATYFALAPAIYRRTAISRRLEAPETMSIDLENGSNVVADDPFLNSARGCSLELPNGQWNEIVAPGLLLHDWTGESGSYSVTIYPDALAVDDFLIEKLVSHPEATLASSRSYQLHPMVANSRAVRLPYAVETGSAYGTPEKRREKDPTPTHYWPEYVGGSLQSELDAVFQMRVWPIPTQAWQMSFDAEILPLTYRVAHLTDPSALPVPDAHAQRLLVPLAKGLLADTRLLDRDAVPYQALKSAQARAEDAIAMLPPVFTPQPQYIGTPAGW